MEINFGIKTFQSRDEICMDQTCDRCPGRKIERPTADLDKVDTVQNFSDSSSMLWCRHLGPLARPQSFIFLSIEKSCIKDIILTRFKTQLSWARLYFSLSIGINICSCMYLPCNHIWYSWNSYFKQVVDCLAKIDAVYLYLSSAVLIMANKYHVCNWLSLLWHGKINWTNVIYFH